MTPHPQVMTKKANKLPKSWRADVFTGPKGAAYPAPFAQQNPEKTYTCTAFAALSFYFTSTLFSHSSHINESAIMYILVHTQLYTEVG